MEKKNKLIAEFMGVAKHYEAQSSNMFNQYHTDWNRLMLVIEEIDHLQYESIDSIENALATRSIKDTYNAVVEFIKEYNDGKN